MTDNESGRLTVLVLTQYYPPEVGATQNRLHSFASYLASRGHDVTVIAEVPNHPKGVIFPEFRGTLVRRSVEDGVNVVRVWVKTAPEKTFFVRLAFYLTYALNATLAGLRYLARRPDVIFVSSPPLTVGLPALALAKWFGSPFVLDVRDLWPVLAAELGEMRNRRALKLAEALERRLYRKAKAITVVTRGFARHVVQHGADPERVMLLPNGTVPEVFHPGPPHAELRRRLGGSDKFIVGFFGNHGIAQGLDAVLDAAARLSGDPAIHFSFVGEGPVKAALQQASAERKLPNVTFLAQVPQSEVVGYINSTDALLVPLKNLQLFDSFIPSKLFDFMACARPVLLQVGGEAREILEQAGAGCFVPPGDGAALAAAITRMAALTDEERRRMGEAGRRFVLRQYVRADQAVRLERLLDRVSRGLAGLPRDEAVEQS